jgi:hypothetical protein
MKVTSQAQSILLVFSQTMIQLSALAAEVWHCSRSPWQAS